MCVSKAMIKKWFCYGILRFTGRIEVGPTLKFFAVTRLCDVDWDAFGSCDWSPYKYKTRMLSLFSGSALTVCELVDGTDYKIVGTEAIRSIYREKSATMVCRWTSP